MSDWFHWLATGPCGGRWTPVECWPGRCWPAGGSVAGAAVGLVVFVWTPATLMKVVGAVGPVVVAVVVVGESVGTRTEARFLEIVAGSMRTTIADWTGPNLVH